MYKWILSILTVLLFLNTAYCIEDAYRDNTSVPSMLGAYNGATKRLNLDANGNLLTTPGSYANKVSSYTAGELLTTGTVSITAFSATELSFLSMGGLTQITTNVGAGIIYVPDNTSKTITLPMPAANTSFTATLPSGTTLYYSVVGVK